MNIFVAIPDQYAGCGFYRQYQPHNRLAKTHKDVNVLLGAGLKNEKDEYMPDDAIADIDILQMHKQYVDIKLVEKCKSIGVITIVDFDDWWHVDTEHLFYRKYIKEDIANKLINLIRTADWITCTTDRLAEEIAKINRNVIVLPNAMDMNYDGCKIDRVEEKETILGYLGGHCHGKDVQQLHGLNNMLSRFDNYKIRLMGVDGSTVYQKYADILSDGGKLAGKSFDWVNQANIWSYPQLYNLLDISLVPLVDNRFNGFKSELKLIEAGFFRKAVIVDNVHPYKPLLKHKVNAMVVNKRQDWYRNAKYLLENPQAVKDLGDALFETVQPYHIDVVTKKRYKFYKDVLKDKHINSSDRFSRIPAVG